MDGTMDVIGGLKRIKEFRENKAELEVKRTRHALQDATRAFHQAEEKLVECRVSCKKKEETLYKDLCSRIVKLGEIHDASHKVDEMRKEINVHVEKVQTAEKSRTIAEEKVEQARVVHHHAIRMRQKFTDLDLIEKDERRAEQQHREDLEMEEVRNRSAENAAELDEQETWALGT